MTDGFTTVDAVLWSVAVTLALYAVWLARPRATTWDLASFFAVSWALLRRPAPLPLTEGPVPPGGWTGSAEDVDPDLDPVRRIGAECTWDALATRAPAARAAVERRLAGTRVVWFEPPLVDLGTVDVLPPPPESHAALEALLAAPEARLVLVASAEAQRVLELLHELQGLRDRVRLVLLIGAAPDAEWLARSFRHETFDLELARATPYCTLRTGPGQVLRSPLPPATGRVALDVVDLGLVPADALADPTLGEALRAAFAAVASGS
jgi:hypothetical protein